MEKISLSYETTTADLARIFESAKNEFELKGLIAEVRKQGERVFGDGFNIRLDEPIHLDETIVPKNFRNRVFIRTV